MSNTNLVCFEQDGIELYIDTVTGESFASKRGYARMSNKDESTIRKRLQGYGDNLVKRVEVQTQGGLQGADLITEALVCEWLPKDNPDMATKLMRLGVRAFLHTLAGYEVSTTAVIAPIDPATAIIQGLQLWKETHEQVQALAIKYAVTEALAAQTAQQTQTNTAQIEQLTAEVQLLKSLINQPIPVCNQTARQRLVELCQVIGQVLVQKGVFNDFPSAIRDVWQRVLLKLKHCSARVDIPNRKAAELRRYDQLLNAWVAAGRPRGQKPRKKDYDLNNAQWIERLNVEQDALACAIAIGTEFA